MSLCKLCMSWTKHDNCHTCQRQKGTCHIPGSRPDPVNSPQPKYCHGNVNPSVSRVCTTGVRRMKREKPCKQCQACGSRNKKPGAPIPFKPKVRQITTN